MLSVCKGEKITFKNEIKHKIVRLKWKPKLIYLTTIATGHWYQNLVALTDTYMFTQLFLSPKESASWRNARNNEVVQYKRGGLKAGLERLFLSSMFNVGDVEVYSRSRY